MTMRGRKNRINRRGKGGRGRVEQKGDTMVGPLKSVGVGVNCMTPKHTNTVSGFRCSI